MGLIFRRILGRASHDNFHGTVGVLIGAPVWVRGYDPVVNLDANAAGHADDHRLDAVHGFDARIEVLKNVGDHSIKARLRANKLFQLRPFGRHRTFAVSVKLDPVSLGVFNNLFKFSVDDLANILGQLDLGDPAFIVDRNSCAVRHGLGDVVDVNVIPKDSLRVSAHQLDWGAGEADVDSVRQGGAKVMGKPVFCLARFSADLGFEPIL